MARGSSGGDLSPSVAGASELRELVKNVPDHDEILTVT